MTNGLVEKVINRSIDYKNNPALANSKAALVDHGLWISLSCELESEWCVCVVSVMDCRPLQGISSAFTLWKGQKQTPQKNR